MLEVRVYNSDYNQDSKYRIAARGFVIKDNLVAVLYSKKYNAYISPGGGIEENESLEDACIREVNEETGMIVKPIEQFAKLDCNYPRIRIEHNYFVCELVTLNGSTNKTDQEKDQDLEIKWLSFEEIKKAYATMTEYPQYDDWMQREAVIIPELRKYLK